MLKECLDAIIQIDNNIEGLFKIKTILQETAIKESFDKLSPCKLKEDDSIIVYVVGMDFCKKNVRVNTPNYKDVIMSYSEFMKLYTLV